MPADGQQPMTSGLTDQQRRAITTRGVSVALSAGAGCGKTFVLTERFLTELDPESSVDGERTPRLGQLVAITFTERAAREMRDRIRRACRRRLQECPREQSAYWLDLIRELDSARISTIHSFCTSLLRSHAVEAGIDPRFRVLDGAQSSALLFRLTDDVLRRRLADRDEAALLLAARLGLDRLREVIARLLAERQQIDWAEWRGETAEGLLKRWEAFWENDTVPRLLRQIGDSAAARTLVDLSMRYPPNHPTMRERCDLLMDQLPRLCGAGVSPAQEKAGGTPAPQDHLAAIRDAAMVQGVGKKHWVSEEVYERFRDAAKSLREAIDAVAARLNFDVSAARGAAEASLLALALAADVAEEYDRRKSELGVLDFNDLLILARRLLVGPDREELRRRLGSQIRLLLVDEFQDTDPLQVELVKALCDNKHLHGKLFFVGDHKQSIYRFRGAQPSVFRELREEIPAEGRLPLSLNFRSQPAILDFVNALFAEELGPGYEPLRPARPQVGPVPAVELLWAVEAIANCKLQIANCKLPDADPQSPTPNPSSLLDSMSTRERLRRIEADWIARRIRGLLDSGEKIVWDAEAAALGHPAARAARPGDFALLFRALTNVEYYEEALRRYGIDYYLVGGHAFYAQQEIYDLLNLLRTLDSPCDTISLAGVLRSPMFGLSDETIFWLLRDGFTLPPDVEGPERQQAEFALATLTELREMKDRLPVAQLIQEALDRTGYDAMLLAEFLGERKLANLRKLVEQARSFDQAGIFTLSDFIAELSEFIARQPDEPLAATQSETTDVVKLMSIHQSKGLEFPVVIVPDLGRPRHRQGPPITFTPELGPALKDPDAPTGHDLLTAADNDEDAAEMSRLLYVATTRAADYLILSAGVEDFEKAKPTGPWMEMLARRFDLATGQQRGEGRGARDEGKASRSCVKVTMEEPVVHVKPVDPRRRRDLLKIVEKAEQMAADGQGRQPRFLDSIDPDFSARRQYSFSRLTGDLHATTVGHETDTSSVLDPRGLGTLVHAVLEKVNFARPGDVPELVQRLAEQHLPAADGNLGEPIEMIQRFLASPRAAQIVAAKESHRELEFLLSWPPDGASRPGGSYFQGFIDCLYRDAAGRWRLIDYKTNQITAEDLAATAAKYEMQMQLYALAVETILGIPPIELVLCFLRPGLEHRFDWNEAAKQSLIQWVNGGIQIPQ